MNKEPLISLTKRKNMEWYKAWGVRILCIVIAIILCGVLTTLLTGLNPISVYSVMLKGAFSTARRRWALFQSTAILLCISLALTPAFKMRFWNVGGEGQVLMGCLGASACMITLGGKVSNPILYILMIVSSLFLGALWGFLPAFFGAKYNTNATLFTLMMNYIATQIVAYFIILWENPKGSAHIGVINQKTHAGWLPKIGGSEYLLSIIVAGVLVVFMYIYLNYTKHGYEISVVGESVRTAKYVGINVKKVTLRTMILSGAICGLTGLILSGNINHTLTTTIVSGRGFTAVMVSWMAQFNPIIMAFVSFLVSLLSKGASEISTTFNLSQDYGDILTGIIIFFIIGSEFFVHYKVHLHLGKKKEE